MNWKKLIQNLRDAGMTQVAIAKAIGMTQPSIVDLLQGKTKSVRWEVGDRLISLHQKIVRKSAKNFSR